MLADANAVPIGLRMAGRWRRLGQGILVDIVEVMIPVRVVRIGVRVRQMRMVRVVRVRRCARVVRVVAEMVAMVEMGLALPTPTTAHHRLLHIVGSGSGRRGRIIVGNVVALRVFFQWREFGLNGGGRRVGRRRRVHQERGTHDHHKTLIVSIIVAQCG